MPPYIPQQRANNYDPNIALKKFKDEGTKDLLKCQEDLKSITIQSQFDGFYFDNTQ